MRALRSALFLLFVGLWAIVAGPTVAQQSRVVVELFTSQGCSSCPPADELMVELIAREDVLPLALHVDYWDYIGWKDSFASPAHSKRQRNYARIAGRRSVYTPQMIVNGKTSIVGARAMELADAIREEAARAPKVAMTLARSGKTVSIRAKAAGQKKPMIIHALRYIPNQEVRIKRGENAGRNLTYHNIVQDWRVVGEWSGRQNLSMSVEAAGDLPVVILVQEASQGRILGAAEIR